MMKKIKLSLLMALTAVSLPASAQLKVGTNSATVNASSVLELEATNKALYMPRVALTSTTDVTTVPIPKAGMMVYNTNAAITGTSAHPAGDAGTGIYYFDGTAWVSTGTAYVNWHTSGNSGTADGTNFLGNTDNVPLTLRVNNSSSARIDNTAGNSFFGYQSGLNTIGNTGTDNTFIGQLSGMQNTTGIKNTALGREAFLGAASAGTGTENVAVGYATLSANATGSYNTATGSRALNKNTTGTLNIAFGYQSSFKNTTGANNTALGTNAGYNNITGNGNTSIGTAAGFFNAAGDSTLAVGTLAGVLNGASYNQFVGITAGYQNATGTGNTDEGYQAGFLNTSGNNNTVIGRKAGYSNATGSGNTALGSLANFGSNNLSNATAIGANAYVTASNSMVLGAVNGVNGATAGTSVGIGNTAPAYTLDVTGDINASGSVRSGGTALTSDARLKRNIAALGTMLPSLMALRPVSYEKKATLASAIYSRNEMGFIAQEIRLVFPKLVSEGNDADKLLAVDYNSLIPVLTKAIQEQQAQIEDLKKSREALTAEVASLQADAKAYSQLAERIRQLEQMAGVSGKSAGAKTARK